MIALAYAIEFLVLRHLVNQDGIILFMATLGHRLFSRRLRPDRLGQRHLQDQARPAAESDLHSGIGVSRRAADRSGRAHRRDHLRRDGAGARGVLPGDAGRPGAARGRRRSPGRAIRRHPAQPDLAHGLGGLRAGRAGRRHDVGRQARRAVLAFAGRAQGAAGAHSRRLHLDPRRDRRRADHRRRREARRGDARARADARLRSRRRRHRELVRLCAGAACSCCSVRRACSANASSSGCDAVFYREAGQFKTSYAADQAIFPIAQDRWFVIRPGRLRLSRRCRCSPASISTPRC